MSKSKQQLNLNIWENRFVTLTLSGYAEELEIEDGTVFKPRTVSGLFINFDGTRVHLNTLNDNPNSINISIRETIIDFVELLIVEDDEVLDKLVN